jgi:D-glycero-D-manno-heptose 1,7-bisphosphate phosphatase
MAMRARPWLLRQCPEGIFGGTLPIQKIEMATQRAVFLDRDGVINPLFYHRDAGIVDSPFTAGQFTLFPRAGRAVRLLNDLGLPVVVVSNQPGIAKRHFTASTFHLINAKLRAAMESAGARLDGVYYCLHHPESRVPSLRVRCACRKPRIGLLTRAARELGLDLERSYLVGDGLSDMEAGLRAGCRTIFIGKWKCEHCQFIRPPASRPVFQADNLWEAAQLIRSDLQARSARSEKPIAESAVCKVSFAGC